MGACVSFEMQGETQASVPAPPSPPRTPPRKAVPVVLGASWCAWSHRMHKELHESGVHHNMIWCDLHENDCPGVVSYPTLVFPDGSSVVGFLSAASVRDRLSRQS